MVTWLRFFQAMRVVLLMCAVVATVGAITAWAVGLHWLIWTVVAFASAVCWRLADRRYKHECEIETLRLFRMSSEFSEFEEGLRRVIEDIGTAFYGPLSQMADAFGEIAKAFEPMLRAFSPPGTVQNPSDPSPRPRRTR